MSSCVRPGVCEARARPERPVSALTSDDLGRPDRRQPVRFRGGEEKVARAGEKLSSRLRPVRRRLDVAHTLGVFAGLRAKNFVKLSQSSTFTPALVMM
jgi:hypothetical protein